MAIKNIRKNFSLFVDGRNYIGNSEDFTPPKLTLKEEEFRGGGMNTPIKVPMGSEALTCEFTLSSFDRDCLNLYNVRDGNDISIMARELLESVDGTQSGVKHVMRGLISEIDMGTLKAGDKVGIKYKMSLRYYRLESGGKRITEIDPENMIHFLSGQDVLAASRTILGF
jgi:P2 family phage contractile tail tube protein